MSIIVSIRIILISAVLLCIFPLVVFADENAQVAISPSSATTTINSQVTVSVDVKDVENLFGAQFDLIFDSNVLEFVSAQSENPTSWEEATTTSPGDLLIYFEFTDGISDSSTLMTLTFNTLVTGTSPLNFQTEEGASFLMNSNWEFIDATWNNGEIIVIEAEEPQPSADITAPSIPLNLTAIATSSSQINLSWSTSTDPAVEGQITSGLAGYKIYRDGLQIATTTDIFYSDTNLTASTTYSYTVSAYDGAGNESEQSEPVSTTTLAEIIPAEISISPSSATTTINSQVTVSIDVKDVENLFGVAFDLIFDPDVLSFISALKGTFLEQDGVNTLLNTAVNPDIGNNTLIVGYSRLAVGATATGVNGSGTLMIVTFKALAIGTTTLAFQNNYLFEPDESAETGINEITPVIWNSGLVTVEVDNEPPTIPTNLIATSISSSQINLSWSSSTDNVGVVGYRIYRQGTQIATTTAISYQDIGLLPSTIYTYTVSAYDAASNVSEQSTSTSATTHVPPAPVGGGGGVILPPELTISNETIKTTEVTENQVTIIWTTNYPATSQVIYTEEGERHTLDLNDSQYGYARITPEYDTPLNVNGVTAHSVIITDLEPGKKYYYRSISRGSLAISPEYSFTTLSVILSEETKKEEPTTETIPAEETEIMEKVETPERAEETEKEITIKNQEKTEEEISEKTQEELPETEPSEKPIVNQPKTLMAAIGMVWDKISQSALIFFSTIVLLLIIGLAIFSKIFKNIIKGLFIVSKIIKK